MLAVTNKVICLCIFLFIGVFIYMYVCMYYGLVYWNILIFNFKLLRWIYNVYEKYKHFAVSKSKIITETYPALVFNFP